MALLPARRNSTLSRPGSQPPARWDPFAGSGDLYQRMGQLLGGAFGGGWPPPAAGWAPPADLSETDEAYLAEAGLPGVARDDISAGLAGQELVISGEFTDTGKEARALRRGRRPGRSGYRVLLPGQADPDPDKVTAALADGVLTVTVPKAEAGKPRRIQITAG
jgi:HSP20 family protein